MKENPRGRFLRITEDAKGKRSTIIVPSTGLEDFQRLFHEMVASAQAMPAPEPTEEPGDSIGNR